MKEILFATSNKGKVKEVKQILEKENIIVKSLLDFEPIEEPIEDGLTFYDNAVIKAKYYYNIFKIPVLTDDSGLEVFSLNNEPGVFSARYSGCLDPSLKDQKNIDKLLDNLKGIEDRGAQFRCSMVFYDGNSILSTDGIVLGKIIDEQCGNNGFGYDPIFLPDGYKETLSSISLEEKNKISHRYKALIKMVEKLRNL